MKRLHLRLVRLEAQRPTVSTAATPPYVHPLSPPSAHWWAELDALIETSPYGEVLMAARAVGECACC